MSAPKYRINPSLLNKFQDYLDSERNWEQFYGGSEDPALSIEEYAEKCEQDLLDACNRVPFSSEAASKGTALNEIVDCILERRKQMDGMIVERVCNQEGALVALKAELDGFSFSFGKELIDELTSYFSGSICQHPCEATIDTTFGQVILYGYPDYIRKDIVYDLKSTSRYEYGKYGNGWQKHVYPYCLIESGELTTVSGFEYTAVHLSGPNRNQPYISGKIYREWYDYSHGSTKRALVEIIEPFIEWIEAHMEQIVHPRIFNQ